MSESSPRRVKMLVIGSGPAGLTAALYAARANLAPVVLSGADLGGQVSKTYTIENYPGFPEGVGGQELVGYFREQAERFGAEILYDEAVSVHLRERPFRVETYEEVFLAETLILATGASPRELNIPGEEEFVGRGVSYCATCDGHFFRGREVIVVGGGDSALEETLYLTRHASTVTVIHRRSELRAGALLQQRAKAHAEVRFVWDTVLTEILGNEAVEKVRLRNVVTGEEREMKTDGVFIFIGHLPNVSLFAGQIETTSRGYLRINDKMQTSVPGVYAAGEVADPRFRQVITSAGMGAAAAMQAIHDLEERGE